MKTTRISMAQMRKVVEYYVENDSTIRKTAIHFGLSKSYVHKILENFREHYKTAGTELAFKLEEQIKKNINERAKRGGAATKAKYLI